VNHAQTVEPLILRGDAFGRGEQQAIQCPDQVRAVRQAVDSRLAALGSALATPFVAEFLARQWRFCQDHDPMGLHETQGIAKGFGLDPETLFSYLHGNIVADMAAAALADPPPGEGCTSWAAARSDGQGAWLVKNRDYRGEHGALQRVFLHADPAWGPRMLMCVGSLGSPGAFSSGINSDGLAVVDTQIDTGDHGVGWLRYFLMTALLRNCVTVTDALATIARVPHAGGGSLVLADRSGALAAVELGHQKQALETVGARWTVRTNHFTGPASPARLEGRKDPAASQCSQDRLMRVRAALQASDGVMNLAGIQALMAGHDDGDLGGPCRHADGDGSKTLSTVIYQTRISSLVMSHGAPCQGWWRSYAFSDAFG
jgi:isopenicillin-N N-acyltransferase like protein